MTNALSLNNCHTLPSSFVFPDSCSLHKTPENHVFNKCIHSPVEDQMKKRAADCAELHDRMVFSSQRKIKSGCLEGSIHSNTYFPYALSCKCNPVFPFLPCLEHQGQGKSLLVQEILPQTISAHSSLIVGLESDNKSFLVPISALLLIH